MRLLAGAEDYGLGPCAKLLAIAGALAGLGVELDFLGKGIAAELARRSQLFGRVLPLASASVLAALEVDGVLAVMEPSVAAWGFDRGLPVFTVDSLYPNWRWTAEQQSEVLRVLPDFRGARKLDRLLGQLAAWPRHLRFFAAHAMADLCLVQRWDRAERGDPGEAQLRLRPVPAIVELGRLREQPREGLLISLSGMVNLHGSARRRAAYQDLIEALLAGLLQGPATLTSAKMLRSRLPVQVRSFAHAEMLAQLNAVACVLAPPGLTSLLECAAYGAPLLLLPEQHRGHVRNMDGLAGLLGGQDRRAELFPEALLAPCSARTRGWFGRRLALEDVQRGLVRGRWPDVLRGLRGRLKQGLMGIAEGGGPALAAAQRRALEAALGGFNGAEVCAQAIIAHLRGQR